ncbi:hypothetical protein POM88_024807 [Heracleum sosnowskyi]|uniref:Uncharacterized protein n=1 Tax=Heracleum sosnowskyi TaxID=360622 RepID=A0AAD8MN82_9APIA|nr:hypothetical protein POM88_024807 [Heracleum sosnowskyi]
MPQKTRLKKRRANRAKSVVEASETETDEETLHQRKRRLVAAHLFGAINVNMDRVSQETEAPASENEEIVTEVVPQATPAIVVEEDILNADEDRVFVNTEAEAVNLDRLNTDATMDLDAPTSKANDVVEEAATHSDSRVFDFEAHTSIYSDHYTEGVEADQVTDQVEESLATHTEIISCDLDKGEEVNQMIKVTENIVEAVMDKEQEAADELNSENVILEALQQSVVEIVQREAEVFAQINSDIPEAVAEEKIDEAAQFTAENILPENAADNNEEAGNDAEGSHSHPSIQVSLADDVNSDERMEVNRQTNEHFQNMYYKNWADADCVFSAQRAANLLSDSVKKISNTDVLTSLQATVVQVKSLNNRFDENQQMFTNLRNEFSLRDTTLKLDRSFYSTQFKQQAKDSKEIKKRLGKVEENQAEMSTQLNSISNALELLTSVLLSDDVKKGESVPKDKCKDIQALRQRDDSTDGGSKGNKRKVTAQRQSRTRVNSSRQINSDKINSGGQSTSNLKSLVVSTNPSTDEEIAAKIFMKEHGKNVTIEDIQAEEQMLAEEHKKNLEAGIYKRKEIKAPRKKEVGISIKENIQQSIQNTRRPVIRNSDKGKGIMIEEPNLKKKDISTSDIAQVETRLDKSTSDAAQVDVSIEDMTTSDVAQVVQKSTLLPGFSKPKMIEDLKLEAVNFSKTRTVLGKEAYDKSGLGSHRERRTNIRSQDNISLAESGVITQENLDMLDSVQMIFHKVLKKEFLLYFMNDGRVYKVAESDVNLKSYQELEYVLYLLKVKNRNTHNAASVIREKMLRSKMMLGGGVSSAYIPKYRDAHGNLVEMRRNSAKLSTALGTKVLEFNLESDKAYYIKLGNEMRKNSIYSLRAAIYQTGESDPELKEVKKIMMEELERAEKKLLSDYIRTVPEIQEIK